MVPSLIPDRVREWAWRTRHEPGPVLVASLPARDRWRLYLAVAVTPDGLPYLARYFRRWFRAQTALPGDRWENFRALQSGVVRAVKRDYIVLEVVSDQVWTSLGDCARDGALAFYPPGAVPSYVRVARDDPWGWMPV